MRSREDEDDVDDLLRPSLSLGDDVARAVAPWDPSSLWMATFFGGGFAAALLFGLNARRLGVGRQALWLAPVLVVATLATSAAVYAYREQLGGDTRIAIRVASVALGAIGWSVQRRRFRTFVTAGGEPGKALLPSLGGIAFGLALMFVFALVYVMAVGVEESGS
jgi:hypothetical protein